MVIRVFHAKIRAGKVSEFKRMWQEESIPQLMSSDGLIAYFAGEPLDPQGREFAMVTLWRDEQALQAIVGEKWREPVVTADEAPLIEEMAVQHYLRFESSPLNGADTPS